MLSRNSPYAPFFSPAKLAVLYYAGFGGVEMLAVQARSIVDWLVPAQYDRSNEGMRMLLVYVSMYSGATRLWGALFRVLGFRRAFRALFGLPTVESKAAAASSTAATATNSATPPAADPTILSRVAKMGSYALRWTSFCFGTLMIEGVVGERSQSDVLRAVVLWGSVALKTIVDCCDYDDDEK